MAFLQTRLNSRDKNAISLLASNYWLKRLRLMKNYSTWSWLHMISSWTKLKWGICTIKKKKRTLKNLRSSIFQNGIGSYTWSFR